MGMSEDRNINEEYGLLDSGRNLTRLLMNNLLFAAILCSFPCLCCYICCRFAVTLQLLTVFIILKLLSIIYWLKCKFIIEMSSSSLHYKGTVQ